MPPPSPGKPPGKPSPPMLGITGKPPIIIPPAAIIDPGTKGGVRKPPKPPPPPPPPPNRPPRRLPRKLPPPPPPPPARPPIPPPPPRPPESAEKIIPRVCWMPLPIRSEKNWRIERLRLSKRPVKVPKARLTFCPKRSNASPKPSTSELKPLANRCILVSSTPTPRSCSICMSILARSSSLRSALCLRISRMAIWASRSWRRRALIRSRD